MTKREFQDVVVNHREFLRPYAISLTNDAEETEDLLQETMLKALSNSEKYQANTNLKAWLYTIMKNIFINDYRRKTKYRTMVDTTDNLFYINSSQIEEPDKANSQLVMQDLDRILNTVSDEYRTPFLMHHEGYKYQEIAEKYKIPLGTVKSRIFLARQELKKKLKKVNIQHAAA